VASTIAYALLFLALRGLVPAQAAIAPALLGAAVANTAANRRFTFGVRGRADAGRHQLQGLLVFGAGLAVTSGSLGLLHALPPARGTAPRSRCSPRPTCWSP
jgi:putative flippase GtrA